MITLNRIVAPATEPVSLAVAKNHLRVDATDTSDDALIQTLIQVARETAEEQTNRAYIPQTLRRSLDAFPWYERNGNARRSYSRLIEEYTRAQAIVLPRPPLIAVHSITYIPANGAPQVLDPSGYQVDAASEPGLILPAPNCYWPYPQMYRANAVQIVYRAGYLQRVLEQQSVPAAPGPYTITLGRPGVQSILAATVSSGPPVVGYTGVGDVLTFDPADAGKALTLEYTAAGPLPARLIEGMLMLIGHWYANREATSGETIRDLPQGLLTLFDPLRVDRCDYESA